MAPRPSGASSLPPAPAPLPTARTSQDRWLKDLASLLEHAKTRWSDIVWESHGEEIHAHKAIVYCRSAGSFHRQYVEGASPLSYDRFGASSASLLSLPSMDVAIASRSATPLSEIVRPVSPGTIASRKSGAGAPPPEVEVSRLVLRGTEPAFFRGILEFLYTGEKDKEVLMTLFDGFGDIDSAGPGLHGGGVERLRQDLLYCWRSKLYTDVHLVLRSEGPPTPSGTDEPEQETTFTSHRAILASRVPYFRDLLLGEFMDSGNRVLTLPSPPFTPASTYFVLGYIYAGTLQFSQRSFNLSTAFEIHRCSIFLSLDLLRNECEAAISNMCTLARSPRIYAFAVSPDVQSLPLRGAAEPFLLTRFGETWATQVVGSLDFETQRSLVARVCAAVEARNVIDHAKQAFSLRRKTELERAPWARHVGSMVDAVDAKVKEVIARDFGSVAVSKAFVDLIDGVGFSTDVLESVLSLVVEGLSEKSAPGVYQILVGSVLLRDAGLLVDARVLVEDARNSVVAYLKRRWMGCRSYGGFNGLDAWALKEISDEIEVPEAELLESSPRGIEISTRTGLRVTPRKPVLSTVTTASGASSVLAPGEKRDFVGTSSASSGTRPAPAVRARVPSSTGGVTARPRPSTGPGGPGPRVPLRTTSRTPVPAGPKTPSAAGTSALTPPAPVASTSRTPPTSAVRRPNVPAPVQTGTSTSAGKARAVTPTSSSGGLPTPRLTGARTISGSKIVKRATSSLSTRSTTSVRSTATAGSSRSGAPATPTPTPGIRAALKPSSASSRAANTLSTATTSTVRQRTVSTAPGSARSATASSSAEPDGIRRPRSTTSLRTKASASSLKSNGTLRTKDATLRRPSLPNDATVKLKRAASKPASPFSSPSTAGKAKASEPPQAPGSQILQGIPCLIVTSQDATALRFKATVRYLGGVLGREGDFVGIEVAESAIPAQALSLEWHDGTLESVFYFELSKEVAAPSEPPSGRVTPAPSNASTDTLNSTTSSVRVVPRSRRANSAESRARGPTKGLFVQPSQVVYVF